MSHIYYVMWKILSNFSLNSLHSVLTYYSNNNCKINSHF